MLSKDPPELAMNAALLSRIVVDPQIMLGKPVIRGTRITVEILLEKLAAGISVEEILDDYPAISREDVMAALSYAQRVVGTDEVIPRVVRAS